MTFAGLSTKNAPEKDAITLTNLGKLFEDASISSQKYNEQVFSNDEDHIL